MKRIRPVSIFLLGVLFLTYAPAEAQKRKKRKQIAEVVTEARKYLGVPYRYGGMSFSGIDCSALIYACYRRIDVDMPRTAKEQSKVGKAKSWNGLREGDLVFFKFKEKGQKWYHSGVITEVKGDEIIFIHASSSRGVTESNLMSDYYRKNVKNFRRII
ncbi:MAG: C40 family peptidase [Bacteroidota bacterium]